MITSQDIIVKYKYNYLVALQFISAGIGILVALFTLLPLYIAVVSALCIIFAIVLLFIWIFADAAEIHINAGEITFYSDLDAFAVINIAGIERFVLVKFMRIYCLKIEDPSISIDSQYTPLKYKLIFWLNRKIFKTPGVIKISGASLPADALLEQINEISPVLYNNSYYSDIKASLFPFVAYRNGFGLARIFAVIFFVLLAGLLPIGFFVQIQESVWQKKYDKALESYENGNLEDAGQYAKEALDTAKNSITLRDSDEPLYSMLLSADIYYDQNKLAEAEPIFRELLAKYEKKDSQFHTFIGKYSFLTAESCFAQGKLDEAEIFYNKALTAQNYSYWADKLMLAKLLRSLGVIYCRKGNLLKSEELLNKALNIYETNSGTDEDTVEVLKNLAETYKKMGKPDQSEMMLERAEGILSED